MSSIGYTGIALALAGLLTVSACAQDAASPGIAALPQCDGLEYTGAHEDCALALADGRQISFDFTPGAATNEWDEPIEALDIVLFSADGQLVQGFADTAGRTFAYPSLEDVDGDGDVDLLLPQETGNVNTTSHVWLQGDAGFAAAGSINGIGIAPEGDGLMSVPARSSAAAWETTYYIARENRLLGVFSISTDLSDNSCSVNDWDGGLAEAGLTLEEATARFCAAD